VITKEGHQQEHLFILDSLQELVQEIQELHNGTSKAVLNVVLSLSVKPGIAGIRLGHHPPEQVLEALCLE